MTEQFNQGLKDIFRTFKDLPSGMKGRLHINELQSKMMSGMRTEPEYAITVLGPFIWQARAEISARKAEFFLNRRYEMDLAKLCKTHGVIYDDAINTVNFMKDAYRTAPLKTQSDILTLFATLLSVVASRELSKRV